MRNNHLKERELFNIYSGDDDIATAKEHLEGCDECMAKFDEYVKEAELFARDTTVQPIAELGDDFFVRQKNRIIAGVGESEELDKKFLRLMPKLIPAACAMLVVILALVISLQKPTTLNVVEQQYALSEEDYADDLLLREIEDMKNAPDIDGLGIFVDLDDSEPEEVDDKGASILKTIIKA